MENVSRFEGEFITDYLKPDTLLVKWEGYCPVDSYQYGFLKGIALSTEKGIKKWIVDLSDIKVINPENQRWTQEVLIKKMNYSGIMHVAVINPQCPLASSSIKNMYQESMHLIKFVRMVFNSVEEAEVWLTQGKHI